MLEVKLVQIKLGNGKRKRKRTLMDELKGEFGEVKKNN